MLVFPNYSKTYASTIDKGLPDPISDQNTPFSTPVFRSDVAVTKFPTGFVVAKLSFESVPKPGVGKIQTNEMFWLLLFLCY